MKCRFQRCCPYGNIINFHAQVKYISVTIYAIETIGPMGANDSKIHPSPWGTWTPSNTWMPGVTPLTMPNDSSIGSRTSIQLHNKGPLVTMGRPKFTPQNYPFPSTISIPSNTPSLNRPDSPSQTASRSNQLFCHNTQTERPTDRQTGRLTDRPTDRWSSWMFRNMSAPLTMLIESDTQTIITVRHHMHHSMIFVKHYCAQYNHISYSCQLQNW